MSRMAVKHLPTSPGLRSSPSQRAVSLSAAILLTALAVWGMGTPPGAASPPAQAEADAARAQELAALQRDLAQWEQAGDKAAQARGLNRLGELLEEDETQHEAAIASYQRSIALAAEAGDRLVQAAALNNLGALEKDDARAIDAHRRALALGRELGDAKELGRALYGLGNLYSKTGQVGQAYQVLSEGLPLRRQAGDACGEARILFQLVHVNLRLGRRDRAQASLEQAERAAGSCDHPRSPLWYLSMSIQFRRSQGELEQALDLSRKAQDFCASHKYPDADVLHSMGSLYLDLGDEEQALAHYQQALERASDPMVQLRIRNSIGWLHHVRNEPDKALDILRQALVIESELDRQGTKIDSEARTGTLRYLGVVLTSTGKPQEGLPLLLDELEIHRKGSDRSQEAKSRSEIAQAYRQLGRLDEAEKELRAALEIARQAGPPSMEAQTLFRLAELHREQGRIAEARGEIERALEIVETVRSAVVSDDLRASFLASKRAYYELYLDLLQNAYRDRPAEGAAAALEASERARARGLLDLLAEAKVDVQQGIAPELRERERQLSTQLTGLQSDLSKEFRRPAVAEEALAELRGKIAEVVQEMASLESEIRLRHPRYAQIRYPAPLSAAEIRSRLDPDTALLEYFVGRQGSYLFVVTRDRVEAHRLPPEQELYPRVEKLRKAIAEAEGKRVRAFRQAASELYDVLIKPAAGALKGRPNLLIAPDGTLHLLPFEALLTDGAAGDEYSDLSYLIRSHAVSYVPSASVLDGLREPRTAPPGAKELVAFGDPIWEEAGTAVAAVRGGAQRGGGLGRDLFRRLSETPREVRSIAEIYGPQRSVLYLGKEALEERVKNNPEVENARRVHFATHGILNEKQPRLSGLVLSRPLGPGEDGYLQFYEIFNLRLNADLVTLSACETALGETVSGEGVMGLTRAFHYAGARSLVVSLWQVDDRRTSDLMILFYRNLDGSGKADALQRSKLAMIREGALPYHWAPFILSGDSK